MDNVKREPIAGRARVAHQQLPVDRDTPTGPSGRETHDWAGIAVGERQKIRGCSTALRTQKFSKPAAMDSNLSVSCSLVPSASASIHQEPSGLRPWSLIAASSNS